MAKTKMTIAIREAVLADIDADAVDAGLSRSEYVEQALVDEHFRRKFARVEGPSWTPADDELARRALAWQNDSVRPADAGDGA